MHEESKPRIAVFQNVRVYLTNNLPAFLFSFLGGLFVWLASFFWNTNTERLSEIARATESTASSMHELVVFVKEDRIKITNLERRMNRVEARLDKGDEDTKDFWENYYVPKK